MFVNIIKIVPLFKKIGKLIFLSIISCSWSFIFYVTMSWYGIYVLWNVSNSCLNYLQVFDYMVRDRPFNLKGGGLWCFVLFRIFFSDNTRVRILFFLLCKARNFFPEFNISLYDKNSESDCFFPPPKSEYFFQALMGGGVL